MELQIKIKKKTATVFTNPTTISHIEPDVSCQNPHILLKTRLKNYSPYHLCSGFQVASTFRLSYSKLLWAALSFHARPIHIRLTFLDPIICIIFSKQLISTMFTVCSFFQLNIISSLFCPNIFHRTVFLNPVSLYSFLHTRHQILHTYKMTDQIIVFCIIYIIHVFICQIWIQEILY